MKCRRIYEGIIKAYQEPLAVTREPCAGEEGGVGGVRKGRRDGNATENLGQKRQQELSATNTAH